MQKQIDQLIKNMNKSHLEDFETERKSSALFHQQMRTKAIVQAREEEANREKWDQFWTMYFMRNLIQDNNDRLHEETRKEDLKKWLATYPIATTSTPQKKRNPPIIHQEIPNKIENLPKLQTSTPYTTRDEMEDIAKILKLQMEAGKHARNLRKIEDARRTQILKKFTVETDNIINRVLKRN